MILSDRADAVLKSHRVEITVVFIDLRGFTAFAETAEPEEVLEVLQEYQTEMGRVISDHHGVIEHFSGDAIMVFLNDPIPVPNHAEQALRMAIAMRNRIGQLKNRWGKRAFDLGAGIGVATGYATLGLIGSEKRKDYAAIGAVTNLAARLCGEAKDGQILISERVMHLVQGVASTDLVGSLILKGFHKPVVAYNVAPDACGSIERGGIGEMGGPPLVS
jgi:class 3 adenylate cyclase